MPRASSLLPWLLILLPPLAIRAAAAVDTTAVGFTEVALTGAVPGAEALRRSAPRAVRVPRRRPPDVGVLHRQAPHPHQPHQAPHRDRHQGGDALTINQAMRG